MEFMILNKVQDKSRFLRLSVWISNPKEELTVGKVKQKHQRFHKGSISLFHADSPEPHEIKRKLEQWDTIFPKWFMDQLKNGLINSIRQRMNI